MGGEYDSPIALAKESSLAALPESPWLRTDGIAKGSAVAASDSLLNRMRHAAHCVTQLSAAAVPDRVAACSVGTTTRPNHMQLQHRPATPVELR